MNVRRLLWIAAVAAALALALVLGAGSLWHRNSSRGAVNRYIKNVDAVQEQMRLPLTRLLSTYRTITTRATSTQNAQQMTHGEQTLRTLQQRLAHLAAPPPAKKLRVLLVRLVEQERVVAHEVVELARFLPSFNVVLTKSRLASAQLARALAKIQTPAVHLVHGTPTKIAQARAAYAAAATRAAIDQAASIDAYDRSLALVAGRLRMLQPPPLMGPAYRSELQSLGATRAAGNALSHELRKQKRTRVALLSRRLSEAARIAGTVASQRAEIAAIKAYDARVQSVDDLQQRIRDEVTRLTNTVT